MRILASEKTEIILALKNGGTPQYILREIVPSFFSEKSKYLSVDYIENLRGRIIKQRHGKKDIDGFMNLHRKYLENGAVSEIFLKFPGIILKDIPAYLREDILFCFSFVTQTNIWLRENSVRHLLADTTYCFSNYSYKLIMFSLLSDTDKKMLVIFIYNITK